MVVRPAYVPAEAFAMRYYADRHVASVDEARLLAADLSEALHFLHSSGFVHCDVKRANVRFDGAHAALIDLDLAVRWRGRRAAPRHCGHTCMARARAPR